MVHVTFRDLGAESAYRDPTAGIVVCTLNEPDTCSGISIVNNTAAGNDYAGIGGAYGHDCDTESTQ